MQIEKRRNGTKLYKEEYSNYVLYAARSFKLETFLNK